MKKESKKKEVEKKAVEFPIKNKDVIEKVVEQVPVGESDKKKIEKLKLCLMDLRDNVVHGNEAQVKNINRVLDC
jgi:hypothetical protein